MSGDRGVTLPDDPLQQLDALDGYRKCFMDPGLWRPFVRAACESQGLGTPRSVRAGLAGTYPTFIVDERWVIKFFGRLFDGALSYQAERQVGAMLAGQPIPAPELIAGGQLFQDGAGWPWPYLVFEFIPGISIGEVYDRVSAHDKREVAREMGRVTRSLHALDMKENPVFQPAWEPYAELLERQRTGVQDRHRAWGALPERLIDQLKSFLPPIDALVDGRTAPHLIHADLTADHLLGRLEDGRWQTLGLIDFGDAMVGNLLYELVALHLDLFRCDKRLLRAYLDAYGLDRASRQELPVKALSVTLLHRFNVLEGPFSSHPEACQVSTLYELAALLWDVEAPGLGG